MLLRFLFHSILHARKVAEIDGIRIADFGPREGVFQEIIAESLSSIRECDPRRYHRVRTYLAWIVNASHYHGHGAASYNHGLRFCKIDVGNDDLSQSPSFACFCAKQLVHEATHAFLCSKGFRYTRRSRLQHERICHAEENRFLRRVERHRPGSAEPFMSKFDPDDWKDAWNLGRFRRALRVLSRINERHATYQDAQADTDKPGD